MAFEKLTAYLDNLGGQLNIPARDVLVTVDGECVYRHFSGHRDAEGTVPMNGKEAYWIYSMTKPVTIACALRLIEDGKLAFDSKVADYIPAFSRHPDITIEELMSMRGGLDYDIETPALKARRPEEGTLEIVSRIAEQELKFMPGTDFLYSLCHDVLAGVIEVASGMAFGDYMKQEILTPLGMNNTWFQLSDYHRANMCAQYERVPESDRNRKIPDLENVYIFTDTYQSGGAGLITTTEDYSKFVTAVVTGKLLKKESIEAWRGKVLVGKARESFGLLARVGYNYALGVQVIVDTANVGCPLGVYGWDGAAGAACMMDPDRRIAIVYLQHVKGCGPAYSEVHPTVRDLVYDGLKEE